MFSVGIFSGGFLIGLSIEDFLGRLSTNNSWKGIRSYANFPFFSVSVGGHTKGVRQVKAVTNVLRRGLSAWVEDQKQTSGLISVVSTLSIVCNSTPGNVRYIV